MRSKTRRNFLRAGVGVAATACTAKAFAQGLCLGTPFQTPGPFPPKETFPTHPFTREPNLGPKIPVGESDADLTRVAGGTAEAIGQKVIFNGIVKNEACEPIVGAEVHMWQADTKGHYNSVYDTSFADPEELDPNFQYWGIVKTDSQGRFRFQTIVPRYYPIGGGNVRTAHLHFRFRHPDYNDETTQTYFEGEELWDSSRIRELNQTDIILTRETPTGEREIKDELKHLIAKFSSGMDGIPRSNEIEFVLTR